MVILVNQLTVTGDADEFERINKALSNYMSRQPGYLRHQLLRSLRRPHTYVELAEWIDAESHQRAVCKDEFQALIRELGGVVAAPAPDLFDIVTASKPPPNTT